MVTKDIPDNMVAAGNPCRVIVKSQRRIKNTITKTGNLMKKPGLRLKKTVHTRKIRFLNQNSSMEDNKCIHCGGETCQIQERQTLKENLETEILVIGGGMAGILTAYQPHKAGKKVLVLEADRIGSGQTRDTCKNHFSTWTLLPWLSEKIGHREGKNLCQCKPGCYPGV